jgi:hypothetical protein
MPIKGGVAAPSLEAVFPGQPHRHGPHQSVRRGFLVPTKYLKSEPPAKLLWIERILRLIHRESRGKAAAHRAANNRQRDAQSDIEGALREQCKPRVPSCAAVE